jgi:hypothetical protein
MACQLNIHLLQRLLHMLGVLAGISDQHLPLPEIAAQHHHLVRRAEGGRQQSMAVQPLDPLAVEHVGFGPAGCVPRLPRIDQEHGEAAAFE